MAIDNIKPIRSALYPNGEAADAFCLGTPSATYRIAPAASTDPFSTKTNKYAESKIIRVTTIDKGCYIKFGDASITDATTSDAIIPQNTTEYFSIDSDYPYVRIIQVDASAIVTVTEIY